MANNDQLKQLLNMGLSALTGGNNQHEGGITELVEHLIGGGGSGDIPEKLMGTVEGLLGNLLGGGQAAAQQAGASVQQAAQNVQAAATQATASVQHAAQQTGGSVFDNLQKLSQLSGHSQQAAQQHATAAHDNILGALTSLASNVQGKTQEEVQQHTQAAHSSIMDALGALTGGAQQTANDAHSGVMNLLGSLNQDQLGSVLGKITSLLGK